MKNVWLLLRVQLSALLGLNKILHLKDKKERRSKLTAKIALFFCMLLLIPALGLYAYVMGEGMNAMGQIALFPAVMLAAGCMMTLISSVSLANGTLFAFRDYDLIMSLPVRNWEIALSRILLGYIWSAGLDLLIMIPCGAVYAWFVRPQWAFYPIFVLTMLAAPVLPMMIGALAGTILARLTANMRGSKYLQMLGSMALALGIMAVSWSMDSLMDSGLFGGFGVMLSNLMNRIYPLTGMYVSAVRDLNWLSTLVFILISAAALAVMTWFCGRFLRQINTALTTSRARGKFSMKKLRASSALAALYKKELRRYVSSPIWLMNTAFGLVLALVGVGVLAFKGRAMIDIALIALEISGLDFGMVVFALGYIGAFIVNTSCTTACSISMEGKHLWLIQSLPVSGFDVLLSKMLVSLTLTIPTSLVIGVGAGLTLRMSGMEMTAVTAMALSYSVMSAALGLIVNLKSHSFDWTTEAAVVKQSAAVGITMLINMLLVIGPAIPTFMFSEYAASFYWGAVALMAVISAALIALFYVKGDKMIHSL
ncbi:MAG: hypothetical protein IJE08_01410 [Clostridia bacterium]|nr:hypothetical protein [Clostridia bacterium]